ncbi:MULTISPECIES: hypothetical protein [Pseudoalteromonas]|uniref:Uncharacterized protein n=1 Tax=Pseudoalteromonas amylolytica TaxID=1859457 RepID=A0A1S1MW92_9GAMM|nr:MULTISPECIES: hypothetical protein [Pseudoalteromonas]OHU91821.1 hypothetical protein BFC16_02340 [Pseudoalteromonas sp. JW3]OHU93147.1 hypothetical protein BET10_02250 [Pseudoalteromonas amylolytica]
MFLAHGLWRVYMQPPYAYMSLKGAFNKEGVLAFQDDLRAYAGKFPAHSITYGVVDLSEFEMSTADSIEDTRQYFTGVTQRGLKHVDYVGANVLARHVLTQLWQGTATSITFYANMAELVSQQPQHEGNIKRLVEISFKHPD